MGVVHSAILFYWQTKWLLHGKFLQRVYELEEGIHIFTEKKTKPKPSFICDEIQALCLTEILLT